MISLGAALAGAWAYLAISTWSLFAAGLEAARHPVREQLMAQVAQDPRIKTDIRLLTHQLTVC